MKTFCESLFFTSIVLLVFTIGSIEYIPTQEQVNVIYASCICASLSFLLAVIHAYCRKIGGITFARFGKLQVSYCITK